MANARTNTPGVCAERYPLIAPGVLKTRGLAGHWLALSLARLGLAALLTTVWVADSNAVDTVPTDATVASDGLQSQNLEGLLREFSRLELLRDQAISARRDAESSLEETRRAQENQTKKISQLERDLAQARRTIETLKASAKFAATKRVEAPTANILFARQPEATPRWIESLNGRAGAMGSVCKNSKVASEGPTNGPAWEDGMVLYAARNLDASSRTEPRPASVWSEQRAGAAQFQSSLDPSSELLVVDSTQVSLQRKLEASRRETDAARQELTRVSVAFQEAWEQERVKATDLANNLASARKQIKALKSQAAGRIVKIAKAPKGQSSIRKVNRKAVAKDQPPDARIIKVDDNTSPLDRLMMIALPDSLLPPMRPRDEASVR